MKYRMRDTFRKGISHSFLRQNEPKWGYLSSAFQVSLICFPAISHLAEPYPTCQQRLSFKLDGLRL